MRTNPHRTHTRSTFENTINHANAIDRNLPYGPRPRPLTARVPSRKDLPHFGPEVSRKLISVGIVMLMVVSAITIIALSIPEPGSAYEVRPNPIIIANDGEFLPVNGVRSGSGLPDDPYIIQGWEISTKTDACISISGTRAHFIIRDVHLFGKPSFSTCVGINLYDAWNGRIEGSLINDTVMAIHMTGSYNVAVTGNTILSATTYAVLMEGASQEISIVNNDIDVGTADGIWGDVLIDGIMMDNRISAGDGIHLYNSWTATISHNELSSCEKAIYASGSAFLTIESNRIEGCTEGIQFTSDTNLVKGNEILDCAGTGVYILANSPNTEISFNKVNQSGKYGIWLKSTTLTVVHNNSLENNTAITLPVNGTGIVCDSTIGAVIYHNNFWNNTPQQAWDDSAGANLWHSASLSQGNFWDNYTGTDGPPPDGIGDTPFVIDADSEDAFPLMDPVYFNHKPVAVVSADPLVGGIGEPITLDGSSSHDPDTGCGDTIEKYRWDFDGDGLWDTGWLDEDWVIHSYPRSGNFSAYLQVMDTNGLLGLDHVLVTITTDVIPEFTSVLVPITLTLAIFAVISRTRNSGKE